jgi:hypothetical protein
MKMETVIRSPQDGMIKKLAHKQGVRYDPLCMMTQNSVLTMISLGHLQGGNRSGAIRGRREGGIISGTGAKREFRYYHETVRRLMNSKPKPTRASVMRCTPQ